MADAMNFSELMRLGRVHVMERVSEQSRQSLPVPVRHDGKVQVAFMYCPTLARPTGSRMAPPDTVAWLDPVSGALATVAAVTPANFGQQHNPNEMLGEFRLPQGLTGDQYLDLRKRLFQLYDLLFAAWAGNPSAPGPALLQGAAREFLQIFGQVSEPPLLPYYHALGTEYFQWVRALARQP
jgi:hypothetical protein